MLCEGNLSTSKAGLYGRNGFTEETSLFPEEFKLFGFFERDEAI